MATDQPRIKWISPPVIARFPNLAEPRRFMDKEGEPKFSIGGLLRKEDVDAVTAQFEGVLKQLKPAKSKATRIPIGEDSKTNEPFITASSSAKFKPLVVDAKNHKLSDDMVAKLGGGSVVRLAATLSYYKNGANEGLTAYLNQVQVIKYVERGGNGTSAFGEIEDGFEVDESQQGSAFPASSGDMHNF